MTAGLPPEAELAGRAGVDDRWPALPDQRVAGRQLRWLRVRAVARRHYYVLLRSPHRLFDVTVWPLVDAVLFGSLGVFYAKSAGTPSAGQLASGYLLAGIILWHVVYQAQIAVATGFLEETWSRNLLSLMVTPVTEGEYVAGVALFGLVKLVLGVAVVALTGFVFYAFNILALGPALVPIVAILLACGWVISLVVVALVLRYGTGAEALAWGIMFVIMPLSGVFFPVQALPAFLRPVAFVLPTTHAFAAARRLIAGGPTPWGQLGLAALTTLVAAAAALALLTHMLRVFRRRGYVTRYS